VTYFFFVAKEPGLGLVKIKTKMVLLMKETDGREAEKGE
jgi:hypothetical protein